MCTIHHFGMNNPYLLRKQLQENEEELSNYLRDMSIWQEQMKRKEHSPPVEFIMFIYWNLNWFKQFVCSSNSLIFRIPMKRKNLKLVHQNLVKAKFHHGIILLGISLMLYVLFITNNHIPLKLKYYIHIFSLG